MELSMHRFGTLYAKMIVKSEIIDEEVVI